MRSTEKKKYAILLLYNCLLFGLLYLSGLYQYLIASSYAHHYVHWGPEEPLQSLIAAKERGEDSYMQSVNEFIYPYTFIYQEKCRSKEPIKILFVVKSALNNFERRKTIRNSWGSENRFSDVVIRSIFLLGMDFNNPNLQIKIEKEANTFKDIIQAEFQDSYYNNTIKTKMGLNWTFNYCESVKYFVFVDDDYYMSTRNILKFLRSPSNYPKYLEKYLGSALNDYQENLFAGFVFQNSCPIRWYFSKWYVSLDEYPYSHWPPYVTAGSYILSRKSLINIYYASLYTKHFRFDDIFLGMAAKKAGLKLLHHPEFYFEAKPYSLEDYKYVIASHGFQDPIQLQNIWNEQRAAGNA